MIILSQEKKVYNSTKDEHQANSNDQLHQKKFKKIDLVKQKLRLNVQTKLLHKVKNNINS